MYERHTVPSDNCKGYVPSISQGLQNCCCCVPWYMSNLMFRDAPNISYQDHKHTACQFILHSSLNILIPNSYSNCRIWGCSVRKKIFIQNFVCHRPEGSIMFAIFDVHVTMQLSSSIKMQLVPSWSTLKAVSKPVWRIPLLCVQWKTPDDGQRNYPKHVEFHSKINLRN